MDSGVEIWRGSVNTWECDSMGHMNIRFYGAKATSGLVSMAAELGLSDAFRAGAAHTLVPRQQHSRLLKEAVPHDPLVMTGAVARMGESDARLLFLLRHADGALAATFLTDVVHVTAADALPTPWPETVRERAKALMVEVPPQAEPRSLDMEPFESRASLARAEALNLRRLALSSVSPADCDVFGRMRGDLVMGCMSDGMPHMLGDTPESPDPNNVIGGAAVEYRVVHLRWPRAGDRLSMRSGWAAAEPRVRRLAHWLLDPSSGEPWAVAATVFMAVDRQARRILELNEDQLAKLRAEVRQGLTL